MNWTPEQIRVLAIDLHGRPHGAVTALAERIGVTRNSMYQILSGHMPVSRRMAAALDLIAKDAG